MSGRVTRHMLVIGAQRGGTTYLHAMLDAHPDIAMARPVSPEPKVFLSDELAGRGLGWYRRTYFAHAGPAEVLGEKSTSYLERPDAADRATRMLGSAEIVVLLRDPVARAVSNWRLSTGHGLEQRPLAQALADNLAGPRAWDPERTSVSPYAYLERGRYVDGLVPWLRAFPGHCHVHFFERLTTDPAALAAVYADLGVDQRFRPDGVGRAVNAGASGEASGLGPALLGDLRAYFSDSDRRLRELLDRELPWEER